MSRALARRAAMLTAAAALITPLVLGSGTAHARQATSPLAATAVAAATNGLVTVNDGFGFAYVLNEDGGNKRLLSASVESVPTWSPDGSRFAYSSGSGFISKRFDGTGEFRVPADIAHHPTWTRDGAFIIYSAAGRLFYVPVDGSFAPKLLFDTFPQEADDNPTVAPNGTVVFDRATPGGSGHQVFQLPLTDEVPTLLISNGSQPDISPDGTKLAYVIRDPATQLDQVWTADADGSNPTQLTNEVDSGAHSPKWSPDGSTVLFLRGGSSSVHPVVKIDVSLKVVAPLGIVGSEISWQPVRRNAVERVWGAGHIETAVAASQYNYETKSAPDFRAPAKAVVLSRDDTYLDALVGSAFAVNQQAPLLVTNRATLDSRVEREVQRVLGNSGTVYLLGGELALAPAVANRLTSLGFTVTRIWGQTHYDTAIAINNRITTTPHTAIVTTGVNFFDALAAGAAAGANPGSVIVLTNGDAMPASSASYLNGLNPVFTDPDGTAIVTAGGPGDRALTNAYQGGQLPSWPDEIGVFELVGSNERETALFIARFFFAAPPVAAVATNRTWFDALTGGAMVGFNYGPLLITDPTGLDPGVRDYLSRNSGNIWSGVLMGGPAALPEALQAPIGEAIGLPGEWDYFSITPQQAASASATTQHHGAGGSARRPAGPVPGAGTAPTPLSR